MDFKKILELDYSKQMLIIGSIISFLLGKQVLLTAFLLMWFSYFVVESYAVELGIGNVLYVELTTLASVYVGMHYPPVFAFLFSYLASAIIYFIDGILVAPAYDELDNPFGLYGLSFGVASVVASLFSYLPFIQIMFLACLSKALLEILHNLIFSRTLSLSISTMSNFMFNMALAFLLSQFI